MRKFLAVAAAIVVVAVAAAGCGSTTVIHKAAPQTAKTTTSQSSPTSDTGTTTSTNKLMDETIAKNPSVVTKVCNGRETIGDSQTKLAFIKGWGSPKGGVTGAEFYDYLVANYC